MCKFKNRTDFGYGRVAGGIIDLVEDAVETVTCENKVSYTWINLDQHSQKNDMTSNIMKAAYGPLDKVHTNLSELF